ncbi:MAG: acyl-CoA thioesterase domain-containing protein, partial [Myxococcota bacterium]
MGSFLEETAVTGENGRYRARLAPEWEAPFVPLGGYVAAIALRAIGAESPLTRPASIHCQFLAIATYEEMEIEVMTLRRGKRSHALHVRMSQEGRLVHVATGWVVDEGMSGLEHD